MPDYTPTTLIANLTNLAAGQVTPADAIRRLWAIWQTPDEFGTSTFTQLLQALRADGNFWMIAVLEYRLHEHLQQLIAEFGEVKDRLDAANTSLDNIEASAAAIETSTGNIEADTGELLAGLNGASINEDNNALFNLLTDIAATLVTIEENTRPA